MSDVLFDDVKVNDTVGVCMKEHREAFLKQRNAELIEMYAN